MRALILCATLLLAACHSSYLPRLEGNRLSNDQQQQLRTIVCVPPVLSLRALVRVSAESGEGRQNFRYVILLREPDFVRIDLLPVDSGFTLAKFIANGDQALFIDVAEKTYTRSSNIQAMLRRKLTLPLSFDDLRTLFSARISARDCASFSDVRYGQENNLQLIANHRYFNLGKDDGLLRNYEIFSAFNEKRELSANFLEFNQNKPSKIELELAQYQLKAELQIKSLELNVDLHDRFFEMQVPQGYSEQADE